MEPEDNPSGFDAPILERAGRALSQDADIQDLLYRYTDRLYRARSLEATYDAALTAICDGLHTDRASIMRFDASGIMRFVAWRGLSDHYRAALDGHSPWTQGETNAEIISVTDIAHSPDTQPMEAVLRAENIRSLSFIPLAHGDRIIGKFMVYFADRHELTQKERELALIIARQLGFAVQSQLADDENRRLAAVVESSCDAIISKTLEGRITSWNEGAKLLFGYSSEEVIGKSIEILIPDDRLSEELMILDSIRDGCRVQSYETIRTCKDGRLVDVSLTISPILDRYGQIVGASKIARDISERRVAAEKQLLLLREMNHRVKNTYAVANSLVSLSVHGAHDPQELAAAVSRRLIALAQVDSMTVASLPAEPTDSSPHQTLQEMLSVLFAPFAGETESGQARICVQGDDVAVDNSAGTALALLFHELATNAAKHGSLSTGNGRVIVQIESKPKQTNILWQECGGPPVVVPVREGFGTTLIQLAAKQIGEATRRWDTNGVTAHIVVRHRPKTEG